MWIKVGENSILEQGTNIMETSTCPAVLSSQGKYILHIS